MQCTEVSTGSLVGPRALIDSTKFPERVDEADDDADVPLTLNRFVGTEIA